MASKPSLEPQCPKELDRRNPFTHQSGLQENNPARHHKGSHCGCTANLGRAIPAKPNSSYQPSRVGADWGLQTLRQACFQENPESAMCVQNLDDSRGLAIRITYRISLRSSSLWEPRHPLLKVVKLFVLDSGEGPPEPITFRYWFLSGG